MMHFEEEGETLANTWYNSEYDGEDSVIVRRVPRSSFRLKVGL